MACVDVVIPTYRPERRLAAAAIRSALDHPRVGRVILVDDGSAPPVALSELLPGGPEPRLVLLRQRNAGPAAARNRGLEACVAPWALLLDDDDQIMAAGLEAMLALGERLNALAVVAARVELSASGEERFKPAPAEWAGNVLPEAGCVFRPTVLFNGSGILYRIGDARSAGLRFDPSLFVVEDRDFLRRLAERGPIAVCAEPAVRAARRADGSNLTGVKHLRRRVRGHVRLLRRYGDGPSRAELRAQTTWLLNFAAKAGLDAAHWRLLVDECRGCGWRAPLKARLRRALRAR